MHWLSAPGPGAPCAIVAEVAQAHDGSLGTAHAFIDSVAKTGVAAIKFQTHIAAAESTPAEPWRRKFSYQDATRYEYWRRMEFTPEQWHGLKAHADAAGLIFLSSPFSLEAVELLAGLDMKAWKIASGETSNTRLLDAVAATGRPVMISSGMSPLAEIDAAVERVTRAGCPVAVMQCSSTYPCPAEKIGLNALGQFRDRYRQAVGLSDHSGTVFPGLAAATLGIELLEVHVTLSREMFGPDVSSSLTTAELKLLADGVDFIQRMRANPVDRTVLAPELDDLRGTFTKSVVAARDLPAGIQLADAMLALKKPGGGIPPATLPEVVGRRLRRAIARDQQIALEDLE
ncbi:N-acetylneuraminate synthase family protein [Dongia sp.]|uniref:N-acetylneuraminate synthase family protein n=1 Tax=Dongia sp. TaxID=1977262 RepID=UPI0035AF7E8F